MAIANWCTFKGHEAEQITEHPLILTWPNGQSLTFVYKFCPECLQTAKEKYIKPEQIKFDFEEGMTNGK